MSREIKFRGIRIDTGEWVYGGVSVFGKDVTIYDYDCIVNSAYEVIPESLGQFTGLNDKKGKQIFFGDILKTSNCGIEFNPEYDEWSETDFGYSVVVEKESELGVSYSNWNLDTSVDYSVYYKQFVEVIGNIHENPELL